MIDATEYQTWLTSKIAAVADAQARAAATPIVTKPLPFTPTATDLRTPPQVRWEEMFARSRIPIAVKDRPAALHRIASAADGLELGCGCESRWAAYRAANPPTIDTVERHEQWVWTAHNAKNTELGKPTLTLDEARLTQPLIVHLTSSGGGLGDSVVAVYAACGLAQASGRRVALYTHYAAWLTRASFPGLSIRPHQDIGVDASGGWDGPHGYSRATASAPSRLWAYCANLAMAFALPAFDGLRPTIDSKIVRPRADGRYAVLAPFTSGWPAREWPAERWTELAAALTAGGTRIIGVGSSDQAGRLSTVLPGHEYRYGCSPAEITDLMLGATVTVANDSGIAHLGGLLNVPTVCVHAGSLPHAFLFAGATSVTSVTAGRQLRRSDANPAALATIPMADVLWPAVGHVEHAR